jgi:DNA excision repair protein ERCC-3
MSNASGNPIIVQSDKTVLLEVDNPQYEAARDELVRFAELEKSPEYIHTYRITPLSLWNAAAAGLNAEAIIAALSAYSKYPLPGNVRVDIADYVSRYGRVKLIREGASLFLVSDDARLIVELLRHKRLRPYVLEQIGSLRLRMDASRRGHIKQALVWIGYPAEDLAGYVQGAALSIALRQTTLGGEAFALRPYQQDAASAFYAGGSVQGGSGVVVLPCGAGKTMVGMAAMERLQCATLILTTNTVAARQWIHELLDKTSLGEESIGEYSGLQKQVRPVTISTYQMMTYRPRQKDGGMEYRPRRKDGGMEHRPRQSDPARNPTRTTGGGMEQQPRGKNRVGTAEEYPHFALFSEQNWGLIIYDEVHLLPAPVFRITAEIQARRRLGLTATLVREDGRESDVFSLIGPKKYDAPWKDLEHQGWIATAECHEIRIPMPDELRLEYAVADERDKYRVAAENPRKLHSLEQLLSKHLDDSVLIIGMYLTQLQEASAHLGYPLITGKTTVSEREKLYEAFRRGEIKRLIVSKVGNFAIDLPDANVAIQISGSFGSRQEEAQRLGRILRPKRHGLLAHFYALVSRDTRDQDFAAKRQLFLTEQGYRYGIIYEDELPQWQPTILALQAQAARPRALASGVTQTAPAEAEQVRPGVPGSRTAAALDPSG